MLHILEHAFCIFTAVLLIFETASHKFAAMTCCCWSAQIVAATNANGKHDNGLFIAFNYVVPLGFLFAGLIFSKWCAKLLFCFFSTTMTDHLLHPGVAALSFNSCGHYTISSQEFSLHASGGACTGPAH